MKSIIIIMAYLTMSFTGIVLGQNISSASRNSAAIAGSMDFAPEHISTSPTLVGVAQNPPTRTDAHTNQLNNPAVPQPMICKRSEDISAGNAVGVALAGRSFFDNSPKCQGDVWSTSWLIAGSANDSRCIAPEFSSGIHKESNATEWVEIELGEKKTITRVELLARDKMAGFPLDFQIHCSVDQKNWTTLTTQRNYAKFNYKEPQSFSFAPIAAKYVRIIATKLREETPKVYYFQLKRVAIYGSDGENYARAAKGTIARAGNPLNEDSFEYSRFYDNIFAAGIKWVLVYNTTALKNYRAGQPVIYPEEVANADLLRQRGVKLIYRLGRAPAASELIGDGDKAAKTFAEAVTPIVRELKGKVAKWIIANEENFYFANPSSGGQLKPEQIPAFKLGYVKLIQTVAAKIREIDPGTPIGVETALFDFGWTHDIMTLGLAGKIDFMGVHVYKELSAKEEIPEVVGTFIKDGKRHFVGEQPYAGYREEIQAYQKMLKTFDPKLKMSVTETSINVGHVSAKSQAKFLARLYWFNYFMDVEPTCWWTLNRGSRWGIIDGNGRRLDAWYAMQHVATTMDYSYSRSNAITLTPINNIIKFTCAAFKNPAGEIVIPYWAAVQLRDENTGIATDMQLNGVEIRNAEAVDMLSGTVHALTVRQDGGKYVFPDMIVRDYPVVIRLNYGKSLAAR